MTIGNSRAINVNSRRIDTNEVRIETNESKSRQNNLIVRNVPTEMMQTREKLDETMKKLLLEGLKFSPGSAEIILSDISAIHKLRGPETFIVRFAKIASIGQIFSRASNLRDWKFSDTCRFTAQLSRDKTPTQQNVFKSLRELSKLLRSQGRIVKLRDHFGLVIDNNFKSASDLKAEYSLSW